jgi:hypothetical protein
MRPFNVTVTSNVAPTCLLRTLCRRAENGPYRYESCLALDPLDTGTVEEVTHALQQAARVSDRMVFFWLYSAPYECRMLTLLTRVFLLGRGSHARRRWSAAVWVANRVELKARRGA